MLKLCLRRRCLISNEGKICLAHCRKCWCQLAFLCDVFFFFWHCSWTGTWTSSVSIPQCTHTSICVQFMANQAGELIQLENNISQKQKEVFWFYPAIKIPWSSSVMSRNTCAGTLLWATNSQRRQCVGSCDGSWGTSNCNLECLSVVGVWWWYFSGRSVGEVLTT